MSISPQALREMEFRRATMRGYHPDDVDEFLERLAAGIELLHERIRQTTEQAVRAEQARIQEPEPDDESMRALLEASQKEADAALDAARAAAARLVAAAESYGEALAQEVDASIGHTRAAVQDQLEAELRRLRAARRCLLDEVSATERLTLDLGTVPPTPPAWPPCLLPVELRVEAAI